MGLLILIKRIIHYHPLSTFLKQLSVSPKKFRMASSSGTGGNCICPSNLWPPRHPKFYGNSWEKPKSARKEWVTLLTLQTGGLP